MERPVLPTKTYFMLYIPCPHCGLRNETEFHYGAEAGVGYPDPNALTDTEWAKYLHIRANPKGQAVMSRRGPGDVPAVDGARPA